MTARFLILACTLVLGCSEAPRMGAQRSEPPPLPMEGPAPPPVDIPPVDITQPVPAITAIQPTRVSTSGGTEITISGRDFHRQAQVFIGGVQVLKTASDTSEIKAISPALPGRIGPVAVTVRNPSGNLKTVLDKLSYFPALLSFAPQLRLPTQSNPIYVRVADLNGDGRKDLIVNNYNSDTIQVFTNLLGTGGVVNFAQGVSYNTNVGYPHGLALGKVNDDDFLDVVTAHYHGHGITVHFGRADGTLLPAVRLGSFGTYHTDIKLGDVNGDGRLDFVVTDHAEHRLHVAFGDGNGGFTDKGNSAYVEYNPFQLQLHDFDRDGKDDMVTAQTHGGRYFIRVWRSNGDGTFSPQTDLGTYDSAMHAVRVADLNHDDRPEIVSVTANGHLLMIWEGLGTFVWGNRRDFPTGFEPRDIAIDDLNGDGNLDIVVSNLRDGSSESHSSLSVFQGQGSTIYPNHMLLKTGVNPWGVEIADLNNDGKKDVVVANHHNNQIYGNSLSVFVNQSQ